MDVTFGPHHYLTYRLGTPYAMALQAAGHRIVNDHGDVGLFDLDMPYNPWLQACDRHQRVVLYPHAGGANNFGLGQVPRHRNTVGQFVVGSGEVELAKIADDIPTVACGWPWTPLQEFEPAHKVRRLLFAPEHQYGGGWTEHQAAVWRKAETKLLRRFHPSTGVQWCVSNTVRPLDETAGMIQAADLVVTASTTVLRLAVALGRPAVLWDDSRRYMEVSRADDSLALPPARILDRLCDVYRYPYGLAQLETALVREASDWRERFIGAPFDPHLCATTFDAFLGD